MHHTFWFTYFHDVFHWVFKPIVFVLVAIFWFRLTKPKNWRHALTALVIGFWVPDPLFYYWINYTK